MTSSPSGRKKLSTYHFLVSLKRRLPEWLRYRLDPYNSEADRFVAGEALKLVSGGRVLDAGAGECRHRDDFAHMSYFGTDAGIGDENRWDYSGLDFVSDLEHIPVPNDSMSAVLNINVLEHVAKPLRVLEECARVLEPGGRLILVAPQSWLMHQAPHDYYRFTQHGLAYLLDQAGFESARIEPVGGTFWNLGSRSLYILTHFEGPRFPIAVLLSPIFGFLIPLLCYYLDKLDLRHWDTLGYKVTASKPAR